MLISKAILVAPAEFTLPTAEKFSRAFKICDSPQGNFSYTIEIVVVAKEFSLLSAEKNCPYSHFPILRRNLLVSEVILIISEEFSLIPAEKLFVFSDFATFLDQLCCFHRNLDCVYENFIAVP